MNCFDSNVFHHQIQYKDFITFPVAKSVFYKTNQLPVVKELNAWFVPCILAIIVRHLCSKWNKFYFRIFYFDNIANIVKGLMRLEVVNQAFKDCKNS